MSSEAMTPGARLGPYEILAELGAGGMGEVYLAKDTRLGRSVAIKVLRADVATDQDRLTRFEREAKAVSALNHPHIVTLYEVGTSDSGPYIVMERIDGRSLREVLNDGPMPLRRLLTLGTQIAEGLAKAHSAGIVHRDLKPGNVMVTADGFAKILDFGLAKLVHPELDSTAIGAATTIAADTASGVLMGTPGYVSPEQAAGRPVDYRADQFALGALLYEMATRARPFARATLVESLAATINEDVEPLRTKRPDAPANLEWLIERCLSKNPSDRYASTSDLARELGSLRDHLSDLTKLPSGALTAASRGAQKKWRLRAGIAALVAATALASFLAGRQMTVDRSKTGTAANDTTLPSFRPLTFKRGTVTGARFGADGKTVYFSAAYGAEPSRVYQTHIDRPGSQHMDLPPGFLLGVSSKQELAVLLTDQRATYVSPGLLIRVPAIGGTRREVLEGVTYADWAPDGEQMAVIRPGSCEFPVGNRIADGCGGMIRVSPKGDMVAIIREGSVEIRDLSGKTVARDDLKSVFGLAWSHDGREVWLTASETDTAHDRALYALDLNNRRRLIARIPGSLTVYDVAPDGRAALVGTGAGWGAVNASGPAGGEEISLDNFGRSALAGLSADGKRVLIDETREVGSGAHLKTTDGKDSIAFEDYSARGLSPDGAWMLMIPKGNPNQLRVVPTGPGQARDLPLNGLRPTSRMLGVWSRDRRRLFTWLFKEGEKQPALYMRDDERPWQPITAPMTPGVFVVSPDGNSVAVSAQDGVVTIYPAYSSGGQQPRRLDNERGSLVHWTADGHLILQDPQNYPARLYKRHLVTGRIEPWRTVAPPDPTGVMYVFRVMIADDDRFYVYQYSRGLNDLFLVRDLR